MTSYTIGQVTDAVTSLFNDGSRIVNFKQIADKTKSMFEREIYADELFVERFRIIWRLRKEHFILACTATELLAEHVEQDKINLNWIRDYIPGGRRTVHGLYLSTEDRDPILQASRRKRGDWTSSTVITIVDTTIEVGKINGWTDRELQLQLNAIYVPQARIEGNGQVTDAIRKLLEVREDVT